MQRPSAPDRVSISDNASWISAPRGMSATRLVAVAALASMAPAIRAARVNPVIALRSE